MKVARQKLKESVRPQPTAPAKTGWLTGTDVGLAVGLIALAVLLGCFLEIDTDIWWHLRTGQLIYERGDVPRTDWYTYTSPNSPWIDLHWGFELLAAGLYALGGFSVLVLAKALVAGALIAVCLLARPRGCPVWLTVACWLPALVLMSGRLYVRPEVFTLLFTATFLVILYRYAAPSSPGDPGPHRAIWLLPALQVLWVNVQGLFIFGPAVVAFSLIDRVVGQWLTRGRLPRPIHGPTGSTANTTHEPPRSARKLVIVLVLVVAACFLNPYHYRGALFPFELYRKMSVDKELYSGIAELRSIGWLFEHGVLNLYMVLHLTLLGVGVVSFLLLALARRFSLFRLLLFAAFSYLGWQANRNSNHFALVSGFVISWNIGEAAAVWIDRFGWDRGVSQLKRVVPRAVLASVLLFSIWAVASGRFYAWAGEGRRFGLGEQPFWHAHHAAEVAGAKGLPPRLLAYHMGQAAVFIFHHGPERKVYFDPRLEVNRRAVYEVYTQQLDRALQTNHPTWPQQLAAIGRPVVLVDSQHFPEVQATLFASDDWRSIAYDPVAAVFVHRDDLPADGPPPLDLGARHFRAGAAPPDLPTEFRSPPPWSWLLRADHPGAAEVEAEHLVGLAFLVAAEPRNRPDLTPALALLAARLSRDELATSPRSADAWRNLGTCSLALGPLGPAAVTDPLAAMPPASAAWDPIQSLSYAQATFYFRQALARDPADFVAVETLRLLMRKRGMSDAALEATRRLAQLRPRTTRQASVVSNARQQLPALERQVAEARVRLKTPGGRLEERAAGLSLYLDQGLAESALELVGHEAPVPWELADPLAATCMHLGYPDRAREIWQNAGHLEIAGPGRQSERMASTYLAEGRYREASDAYRKSLEIAPNLVEAHWGLARLYVEVGDAPNVLAHCQAGGEAAAEAKHRHAFEALRRLVAPYARSR